VRGLEAYLDAHMSCSPTADIEHAFSAALTLELDLLSTTQTIYCKGMETTPAPFLPSPASRPAPVIFATDFDVTCTLADSCETLMHLAAAAAAGGAEQQCRERGGSAEECALAWEAAALGVRTKWDHVLERYSKNLQTVIQEVLTSPGGKAGPRLDPPAMEISLPESSALGSSAPIPVLVLDAAPVMQIELPSPSASSEPSESPRFGNLPQAASQPDLSSYGSSGGVSIPRSPSEPSDLGRILKAPSRAFDIDGGAAVGCLIGDSRPFDPEGLRLALERLGELENATNTEVEAAGVLKGTTAAKIFAAAAEEVRG
jgi:hypothetical protein